MMLPDILHTKVTLNNGLTVIIHEDHKAPIVCVNVWYHVGSKNEPKGRSGFAHLFEHLMFNGSENFNDDYFQALERAGATELNGTTSRDRTNYFQNVPTSAFELALWMESDRMGHLLGAIDQEKLDEQRRVVKNEKRQYENQPYGLVRNRIVHATYPERHPYDHTVIGSMEDLDAASVEDVHDWFKRFYGPNNAVLVIAGDVDTVSAQALSEKYFGDIAPGPPVPQFESWISARRGLQRDSMQDRVPQSRVHKIWNVPPTYTDDYYRLGLASSVLASGMNSRLYKRLIYEDRIATDASAYLYSGEIGSQFMIEATAHPGEDLEQVENILDEELGRLMTDGPTEYELRRAVTENEAQLIRRIERVGGFGGKSAILAQGEVYRNDPSAYQERFRIQRAATPEDIQDAVARWLSDGVYVLSVTPFISRVAKETGALRDHPPKTLPPKEVTFPAIERTSLSEGLPVVLAERHAAPLVHVTILFDAGYAADKTGIPGTASLVTSMLHLGTEKDTGLEISDRLSLLGASIGAGSNLDGSFVSLSAITDHLEASLDLFADITLTPTFPESEFDRIRQERLAHIQSERASPQAMALRAMPKLLYGKDHAYSLPFTGSGTEATVISLTRDDLIRFHQTWLRPGSATMVVAGDTRVEEIVPLLKARFGHWGMTAAPPKNIDAVAHPDTPSVYLVHRPGSVQSLIFGAHLAPPRNVPSNLAIGIMNRILGGSFTSRINMNLREDKGWCYGAQSLIVTAQGQRPFLVVAPVQADKTGDAISEILRELHGITGDAPPTPEEVCKAQESVTHSLAGRWETSGAVEDALINQVQYDLPPDYYDSYARSVRALSVEDIRAAALDVLKPHSMVWVVVGDADAVATQLSTLDLGPVTLIDADGNALP